MVVSWNGDGCFLMNGQEFATAVQHSANVVIVVVTVIESLRAFDLAYIINQGTNGLELLSILITNNSISEASLVGRGSAIAVILLVISLVPITLYLTRVMRSTGE